MPLELVPHRRALPVPPTGEKGQIIVGRLSKANESKRFSRV